MKTYEDYAVKWLAKELGKEVTEENYSEILSDFENEPRWQSAFKAQY